MNSATAFTELPVNTALWKWLSGTITAYVPPIPGEPLSIVKSKYPSHMNPSTSELYMRISIKLCWF